mgnify:CR=1 FL=1
MLLIPIFTMEYQNKEQIQYQSILIYERWYKINTIHLEKKKSAKTMAFQRGTYQILVLEFIYKKIKNIL